MKPFRNGDTYSAFRGLTNEVIEEMQANAKTGQKIQLDADNSILEIYLDKQMLKNIFLNLLSNAIKFTAAGDTIQVSLMGYQEQDREFIRLDVKDTGAGIEEKQVKLIFNLYYTADS